MIVILSRIFQLNKEQEKLVKETSNDCGLSYTETADCLFGDGQLELENFYEYEDKILFAGEFTPNEKI